MDTDEKRPDIVDDGTQAEVNALRNLLSQLGDPDAAHEATQTEQNTANIDYLLMTVGGDQ